MKIQTRKRTREILPIWDGMKDVGEKAPPE